LIRDKGDEEHHPADDQRFDQHALGGIAQAGGQSDGPGFFVIIREYRIFRG
jgi:hypothetical protein